jgi:hypothetical protein
MTNKVTTDENPVREARAAIPDPKIRVGRMSAKAGAVASTINGIRSFSLSPRPIAMIGLTGKAKLTTYGDSHRLKGDWEKVGEDIYRAIMKTGVPDE